MAIFNSFLYVYQRLKSIIFFSFAPQAGAQYLGALLWKPGLAARNALRICGGGVKFRRRWRKEEETHEKNGKIHGKNMDFIHGEIMDDWNHGWFIVIFMGIWCLDAYFFWVQPKIHRSRSHFVGGPLANLTITKCLGRNRIRAVAVWVQGGDRFYSQRRCQFI